MKISLLTHFELKLFDSGHCCEYCWESSKKTTTPYRHKIKIDSNTMIVLQNCIACNQWQFGIERKKCDEYVTFVCTFKIDYDIYSEHVIEFKYLLSILRFLASANQKHSNALVVRVILRTNWFSGAYQILVVAARNLKFGHFSQLQWKS